ncbi:MAG: SOS response-associated peptidase family protein [Parasphingorhabdus sp.]
MQHRLRDMALEALEQVCSESRNGPAVKTRSLAFTLAYLWSIKPQERWRYDGFWKAATGEPENFIGWSRSTEVTGFLSGIYHSLGLTRTASVQIKFDSIYRTDTVEGMCNHYRHNPELMAELQSWKEYIGWSLDEMPEVSTDVWPKRDGMVIRSENERLTIDAMQWGVPLTMKGKRPGTTVTKNITNVRNLQSRFWRPILDNPEQRCLVPFTEFAEPKKGREEYWFRVPSRPVAAFAGIWRESDAGKVFAFLTCEPNPLVAPLHPKAMPVILDEENYNGWLSGANPEEFAKPYPSQLMKVQ